MSDTRANAVKGERATDPDTKQEFDREEPFFANSIDMLCFLDFNGYFKRLNPAWERTLGFTLDELMSKPFIEFVHPDDRERTLNQNASVRGGGQALAFENRYLCKDGSYRWFRWNATAHTANKVIYSVARDVTESKRLEEEREQLVRELQAALAEVNTLREILPICSYCRKIRDDENYWHTVEDYISEHTASRFSHGICPSCLAKHAEPQLDRSERE
jgi:PAS domain S-box-containing protein